MNIERREESKIKGRQQNGRKTEQLIREDDFEKNRGEKWQEGDSKEEISEIRWLRGEDRERRVEVDIDDDLGGVALRRRRSTLRNTVKHLGALPHISIINCHTLALFRNMNCCTYLLSRA